MQKGGSLALLVALVAGCGGPEFSAAPMEDGAAQGAEPPLPDAADVQDRRAIDPSSDASADSEDAARNEVWDAREPDEGSDADGGDSAVGDSAVGDAAVGDSAVGAKQDADASEEDASEDASVEAEACAPVLYFLDGDGDGYGGTTTVKTCVPPDSGAWVTSGGDCDDSNAAVNPGQSAYFSAGYIPTGKSSVSFDYNCDGDESESGTPAKASCQLVSLSCVGSGYIEASPVRGGSGVDAFCGSTEAVTCALSSLSCKAGAPYAVSPIACH
jgi:hypothetical protein